MARSQRECAERFRIPNRHSCARAGDDLRRSDQERFRTFPARWQTARLSQPDRRKRVGRTDERSAATRLLRECVARRDDGRFPRFVRRLFRNDGRTGLWFVKCRRYMERDCARSSRGSFGRSANAEVTRQKPEYRSTKSETISNDQLPKSLKTSPCFCLQYF